MKIANKGIFALSAGAALMIAAGLVGAAQAADAPAIAPPPAAMAAQSPNAVSTSANLSNATSSSISKDLSGAEDRAVDNAKGVIKKLDMTTDTTTLEDLNAARQAIARLQAMTEVEKHLAELEHARSERTGHSMASAIPASALIPPPEMAQQAVAAARPKRVEPEPEQDMPRPVMLPAAAAEIARITGTDGRYEAMIKAGGDIRNVRVGDKLANGGVVTFISPTTVQIEENGSTHTLHVKNADVVYSAMR